MLFIEKFGVNQILLLVLGLRLHLELGTALNGLVMQPLKERQTDREREIQRQRDRQRQRDGERQRDEERQRDSQTERETETERDRDRERQRQTETAGRERQRDIERETERHMMKTVGIIHLKSLIPINDVCINILLYFIKLRRFKWTTTDFH